MQFTLSVLASLVPLTLAQYGGAPAPVVVNDPSTTSAAAAPAATQSSTGPAVAIQTVSVGADGNIAYSPNTLTAAVGSQVEFVFFPPTHSVTQGSFDTPCVASETNGTGFWSGAMTTASGMNANSFTITINDTNPIWFFCSFPTHCENFGMAGVINPPTDGSQTLAMYQAAAAKVSNPTSPSVVQGGVIGPVKAATAATQSSAGSSSPTTSATTSSSSAAVGNAGVESRGGVQWVVLAITGIIAVGFGSLIV